MPIVEVNGQELEFPDDMTPEAIKGVLQAKFPKPEPSYLSRAGEAYKSSVKPAAAMLMAPFIGEENRQALRDMGTLPSKPQSFAQSVNQGPVGAASGALGSIFAPVAPLFQDVVGYAAEKSGATPAQLENVQAALNIAAPAGMKTLGKSLGRATVSDVANVVKSGASKLPKIGEASGNTFPNGVLTKTAPNIAKGRGFPDTEEILKIQSAGDDAVSQAYQGINATLRPEAEQALKSDLLNKIGSLQINPAASPKTIGAVKALYDRITVGKINPITGDVVKAPLSVPEVDGFRRLLGGTAGEDAAASGAIRSTIDDFLNKLDETKFATGGPEAVSKLNAARATATRNFKMQKFSDMVKNADGNPAKIQKAAFNFLKDDANLAGLSPEAIAALKNVRDGFGAQKALQFLGRLGFDQNSAWGPAVLGLVGGAPVTIPATAARYANKLAVRGAAKTALDSLSPQQAGKMSPSEVVSALRAQMKKGK